jgi:protein SCO1/2
LTLFALSIGIAFALPWLFWFNQNSGYYGLETRIEVHQRLPWLDASLSAAPNHYLYVMFGFLNCTDTCPGQLTTLVSLASTLADQPVHMVYISLDPERDTQKNLDYVRQQLGDRFTFVRPDSLRQAQQASRVFGEFAARVGSGDDIQHTGRLYLLNPQREVRLIYSPQQNRVERLADDLSTLTATIPMESIDL